MVKNLDSILESVGGTEKFRLGGEEMRFILRRIALAVQWKIAWLGCKMGGGASSVLKRLVRKPV